ncbi:MAG: hypothetical protein EXS17_02575 [Phycisphaerales bacterium]|nr:hypothetical protein [Phycisphaerales bacterium]
MTPPKIAPVVTATSADLDADFLALESLGLRIQPPKGAILTKPITGAMPIYTIDDSLATPRYHMQVQSLVSSLADPTPEAQVSDYLDSMRKKGQKFTILANQPWLHPKVPGHLLYTSTDLGEGVIAIQGWLVLQTGPFDFVVFSVLAAGADFGAIRPVLEASFVTIQLDDLEQIAVERLARLRRGYELIQTMTAEKLQALCDTEPRMYRVWQADDKGREQEIGYYRVAVRGGTLSDASSENTLKPSENPTGILVLLQGRTIVDSASGRFADTEARFWSSWDRTSEAWTSRVTERGGKLAERSIAQTGLRSPRGLGNPRQNLVVINANAQSRTRDEKQWTVPMGIYLSQAETLVLGELLPHEGKASIEFAYYAFDARSMQMPQRVETWTRSTDRQWMLVTQPGIDEAADITMHDAHGRKVRRTEPDGVITELCLPRQLQQIWAEKRLPTQ